MTRRLGRGKFEEAIWREGRSWTFRGGGVCVCVLVEGESDGGGANDRSEAGRVDMIRRGGRRCEGQHN